jgi:hypothetical protein
MSYDPTATSQVPATAVQTGSYLHRQGHPTVNIGTKHYKAEQVVLGLVTPPKHRTPDPSAKYKMVQVTYELTDMLTVSKLP